MSKVEREKGQKIPAFETSQGYKVEDFPPTVQEKLREFLEVLDDVQKPQRPARKKMEEDNKRIFQRSYYVAVDLGKARHAAGITNAERFIIRRLRVGYVYTLDFAEESLKDKYNSWPSLVMAVWDNTNVVNSPEWIYGSWSFESTISWPLGNISGTPSSPERYMGARTGSNSGATSITQLFPRH